MQNKKIYFFYCGAYTIAENINDLSLKVENKNTRKALKVHYDRLKNIKKREKTFTPEPQSKRNTIVKQEKIDLKLRR